MLRYLLDTGSQPVKVCGAVLTFNSSQIFSPTGIFAPSTVNLCEALLGILYGFDGTVVEYTVLTYNVGELSSILDVKKNISSLSPPLLGTRIVFALSTMFFFITS